ncbi:MAG: 3-deoxy-D-manno-octulosonic acid transferase [Pseudomonadota bacterium]
MAGLADRLRGWVTQAPSRSRTRRFDGTGTPRVLLLNATEAVAADLEDVFAEAIPTATLIAPGITAGGAGKQPAEPTRRAGLRWLEELSPSLVVWFGALGPDPLLTALVEADCPAIAVDVPGVSSVDSRSPAFRRSIREALGHFGVTCAHDANAVRRLRALAPTGARIEALGHVRPIFAPPGCRDGERDALAQALRSRPVWLAAYPGMQEMPAILAAHRAALRGAHRLLLIVATDSEAAGSALAADLRAEGWQVARRGAEAEPDDTVEIFVADAPEEIGLWYRLAPTTFLGGTLAGPAAQDVAGPAALGSALIAGPRGGNPTTAETALFARLRDGGGLRSVSDADGLALAVADLLSPDKAAAHAHAAWDVISDSARVLERIAAEVRVGLRAVPD